MTATLFMHWPMDEVSADQKVYDASGNGRHGQVNGTARAVPDERFGSALNTTTANQYVQGTGMNVRTYTFGVWVRTATPIGPYTPLMNRRDSVDVVVNLNADGSVEHRFVTQENTGNTHTTPAGLIAWNTWQHIAITNDAATAKIYVNGELADAWDYPGVRDADDPAPLVLGADLRQQPPLCTAGRFAHLRAYDAALTPAEIQRDLAEDSSTLAAFVRAHPMDLELLNLDEQPVLFIDNAPSGQPMTLRLTNSSRQNIELMPMGTVPSSGNYHVAARLRPGVLSTPPAVATGSDKWQVQATSDGTALYLVGADVGAIAPGSWVDIPLTGLRADPGGGTRGTRVQFDFRRLKYSGETDELTGSRLQFVDIVNDRGRSDIPLVMGFAGGNTVINDGVTQSKLAMYVANTSTDTTISLAGGGPSMGGSLLTLTFDVGADGNDWALTQGTAGVQVGVTTPGTDSGTWHQIPHSLDTRASWTFYPPADFDLPPGKSIVLTVDKVVGLGDPGRAGIVIGYENIPGYRDGARTLEADRQPLAFSGAYTGVGTQSPSTKLHVLHQVTAPTSDGSLLIGPPAAACLKIGYGADHAWVQSGSSGVLALNPSGNRVIVGATGTTTNRNTSKLVVVAPVDHLQLRRTTASGGSGKVVFLELFQEEMTAEIYPTIRFHQAGKFWHQLEGRADGFHLVWSGDSTTHSDLIAREVKATKLTLGATSITADQLQILARLAAGQLKVTLYNDEIQATASPFQMQSGTARPYVVGLEQLNRNTHLQQFRLVIVPA